MNTIKNILILAGGDGDRFWPLTDKNLVPFNGKPFIKHLTDLVRPFAQELHIVGSAVNIEKIKRMVGTAAIYHVQEANLQGMGGAVVSCKGAIRGPVLILNACDIFSSEVFRCIDIMNNEKKDLVFTAKKMDTYFPGGYVRLDGEKVLEIIEKPKPEDIPSNYVRMVADCFPDFGSWVEVLESIHTEKDDWYETGLNKLITKGNVSCNLYDGYWLAIKYAWNVLPMNKLFLGMIQKSEISPSATISKTAIIQGNVIIGDNVRIGDYVKIVGPCYIGSETIVGDHTLIRESYVGKQALVGSGCEVARSYLFDGCMLHRNYVGDSVLGEHVLCGAGAVTANFRFDTAPVVSTVAGKKINTNLEKFGAIIGRESKIGVNTTLFPGTKIGTGTLVAPGEIVESDLPERSFVKKGVVRQKI